MARGRFISNTVITDRQIHELSNDTCRLAYTWLITLADREGRVIGEPDLLLAQLFPRRLNEITPVIIERFINEWVNAGFVIWYEGKDGDRVLQLVNFEKHQVGLRKDRETESEYDMPDDCRIIAGTLPEQCPVNVNVKSNDNDNDNNNNINDLFDACRVIYETKKGRPVTDGASFSLMIKEFEKRKVTPEDYAAAIVAMDADPNYKGTKPTSYETWAVGIAEKRNNPKKRGNSRKRSETLEEMTERLLGADAESEVIEG